MQKWKSFFYYYLNKKKFSLFLYTKKRKFKPKRHKVISFKFKKFFHEKKSLKFKNIVLFYFPVNWKFSKKFEFFLKFPFELQSMVLQIGSKPFAWLRSPPICIFVAPICFAPLLQARRSAVEQCEGGKKISNFQKHAIGTILKLSSLWFLDTNLNNTTFYKFFSFFWSCWVFKNSTKFFYPSSAENFFGFCFLKFGLDFAFSMC